MKGARITFQVEARDESELIARGVHRLHVNGYITGQTINVNGGWYMS